MGKHARIAAQFAGTGPGSLHHPCYLEYFRLFNETRYYEAHDVLEHIWLGSEEPEHTFYKALIQFAGAFVHLQHQHREPDHRVHGRRLRPASRLFRRSAALLDGFPAHHGGIDLDALRRVALEQAERIEAGGYAENPWSPTRPPLLAPPA